MLTRHQTAAQYLYGPSNVLFTSEFLHAFLLCDLGFRVHVVLFFILPCFFFFRGEGGNELQTQGDW